MTFDDLFTLTAAGPDRWTGPDAPKTDERMVFGGLVVGQALVAASAGTRRCHALHAFFIGMGEKQVPFDLSIEKTRDGGSFATRHFRVHQGERLLLAGYSSHHNGDDGPEHQAEMPDVASPDRFEDLSLLRIRRDEELGKPPRRFLAEQMLDMRHVGDFSIPGRAGEATHMLWFRARARIQGGPAIHQAALAFASDIGPVHVGLKQHAVKQGELQKASLDHSIWFHRDAAADEWMLYVLRSPILRDGRGLGIGSIFTRTGELVASVSQEFLARSSRPQPRK